MPFFTEHKLETISLLTGKTCINSIEFASEQILWGKPTK
jgi:hypothetical protein